MRTLFIYTFTDKYFTFILCFVSILRFSYLQSQSNPQTSNTIPPLSKNGLTRTHKSEKIEASKIDHTIRIVGTPLCFPIIPLRKG
ncbi:hypothetical protein HanPSC8_Chr05g0227941 [Helianthus annuus]|nr:hypothetical protein HanPSC8_Chr05g0227941 [Helianthus annuus]